MATIEFSEAEHARIRDAIAAAEKQTAGEIAVAVTPASGDYRLHRAFAAALAALALPLPLLLFTRLSATDIYIAELAFFGLVYLALSLAPLDMLFVPPRRRAERAHANAASHFLSRGLLATQDRTGVLLFISMKEHHAEIIVDKGVAAVVEPAAWQAVIGPLTADLADGRLVDGITGAAGRIGAILAPHLPPRPGDRNEISDDVRIV